MARRRLPTVENQGGDTARLTVTCDHRKVVDDSFATKGSAPRAIAGTPNGLDIQFRDAKSCASVVGMRLYTVDNQKAFLPTVTTWFLVIDGSRISAIVQPRKDP
jgi:hypothetical protein